MTRHPHVTGAILAGGRALRLGGEDKGALRLGPQPSQTPLARILAVFDGRFEETILVLSRTRADPGGIHRTPRVRLVIDHYPGCGPLGGLHAALDAAATPLVFVCACDMPFLSGPLIDALVARAECRRPLAPSVPRGPAVPLVPLVPMRNGLPEPLHAVYPASLAGRIAEALSAGVRKMTDFFDRAGADYLPEEEYQHIDGAGESFENINTPEDLERAGRRLAEKPR